MAPCCQVNIVCDEYVWSHYFVMDILTAVLSFPASYSKYNMCESSILSTWKASCFLMARWLCLAIGWPKKKKKREKRRESGSQRHLITWSASQWLNKCFYLKETIGCQGWIFKVKQFPLYFSLCVLFIGPKELVGSLAGGLIARTNSVSTG